MRLKEIYKAASRLFIQQGYSKTQINHIAKAVGVSVGAIYLDFSGKRDIIQFILKCVMDPAYLEAEHKRPIVQNNFSQLEEEIRNTLRENNAKFSAHLPVVSGDYTFEELLSDAFDLIARYAVGILFIEKNQFDFVKLADYYRQYRTDFYHIMTEYCTQFMEAGIIRRPKYAQYAVTNIIETLMWWAVDIHYNAFEIRELPLETAKEVALDSLIPAYRQ